VIALFGCALSLINFSIDEIINPKLRNQTRAVRKSWGLSKDEIKRLVKEDVK
jgi:peptide/nickel transport system permease protein